MISPLLLKVGTHTLNLDDYDWSEEPIKKDAGRIGTKIKLSASGYIDGTDQVSLQAGVVDLEQAMRAGRLDVAVITHDGSTSYVMPAAACADGGPHFSFTTSSGDTPLQRRFKLNVSADFGPLDGVGAAHSFKVKTRFTPDGRTMISQDGDVIGPGSAGVFTSNVLPTLRAQYPWPQWSIDVNTTRTDDTAGLKSTYSVSITQMNGTLPGTGEDSRAVDGTLTEGREIDDGNRKKRTWTWDLQYQGNPLDLLDLIRPPEDVRVVRERVSISTLKESRLTATFETVDSADESGILNWQRDVSVEQDEDEWEEKVYPGADPILVRRPKRNRRITESGSASSLGKWAKPPTPLAEHLAAKRTVRFSGAGAYERVTSWSYNGYVGDDAGGAGDAFDPVDLQRQDLEFFGGGN